MRKINYKSDFDFILALSDSQGKDIGFPDYNWKLDIFTKINKSAVFTASSEDGELTNCVDDNGRIHIACDNHKLGKGRLYGKFYADIPNVIYADGTQVVVVPFALGITLVDVASDSGDEITVAVSLPISSDSGE